MKITCLALLFTLSCHFFFTFGQGNTSIEFSDKSRKSSFHIQTHNDKNYVFFNIGSKQVSFDIYPTIEDEMAIEMLPNIPIFIGVGASLFDFNFVINVKIPDATQSKSLYGSTIGYFIFAKIFTDHFIFDINYKQLRGFYIPQNNNYLNNLEVIKLSNADLNNISTKVSYIFSPHRYVPGIGRRFGIRQLRSAGSFSLISGFGHYAATNLGQIGDHLPEDTIINVKDIELNQNYFTLLGGYGHNFVIKRKIVIHLNLSTGVAYQFKTNNFSNYNIGIQIGSEFSLIFDNGGWFTGIGYSQDSDFFTKGLNSAIFSAEFLTLTFGKRFIKRGILKKYSFFDLIPWYDRQK